MILVGEAMLPGKIIRTSVDIVVSCPAFEARLADKRFAEVFIISHRLNGSLRERHVKLDLVARPPKDVFIAGCCQSPKDVFVTIAQSSDTVAKMPSPISEGRIVLEPAPECT